MGGVTLLRLGRNADHDHGGSPYSVTRKQTYWPHWFLLSVPGLECGPERIACHVRGSLIQYLIGAFRFPCEEVSVLECRACCYRGNTSHG